MFNPGSPRGWHNGTVIGFSAYLTGDDVHYVANDIILFTGYIFYQPPIPFGLYLKVFMVFFMFLYFLCILYILSINVILMKTTMII